MPVLLRIVDGIVHLDSDADATFADCCAAVDQIPTLPGYRPGMGILHDWRTRTSPLSTTEIRDRSDYLIRRAAAFGNTRWAVLVSRTVDFGMGRMAQAFVESKSSIQVGVFREPAEAEAWLRGR